MIIDGYYADEGRHDPVRISIPKGAYVPSFTWQDRAGVAAQRFGRVFGDSALVGFARRRRAEQATSAPSRWRRLSPPSPS